MFLCQDLVSRYCLFDLFIVVLLLVCIIVPHFSNFIRGVLFFLYYAVIFFIAPVLHSFGD